MPKDWGNELPAYAREIAANINIRIISRYFIFFLKFF